MSKNLTIFLTILSVSALLVSAGIYIGTVQAKLTAVESASENNAESIKQIAESMKELAESLRVFTQDDRFTLQDAQRQHTESYKRYVQNPNGFWLKEPKHEG